MKLYLTYGVLIALGSAILNMILFALGYHTENLAMGQKLGWLGLVITIVGISLGMREYRNEVGQGVMSYGRGFATGFFISLWAALFSAIFTVIYFGFINKGFAEANVQFQLAEMERKGVPPEAIAQSEGIVRMFSSTPAMTIMAIIMGVVIGAILSLILAVVFKSKPGQSAPPPVAV